MEYDPQTPPKNVVVFKFHAQKEKIRAMTVKCRLIASPSKLLEM